METRVVKNIRKIKSKDKFVYNLTVDKNQNYFIEKTLLHNSPNIVSDDASLIPNPVNSIMMRMLGGHKDNFLMKIGNPFRRNHFLKSSQNPKYHKVKIDWKQAVEEGRMTVEFIDEMKKEAFFDILYECKFPEAGTIDEMGWMSLLTEKDIEDAMKRKVESTGPKKLGVDIGGGGAYNAFVIRTNNYAFLKEKNRDPDVMATVGKTLKITAEERIREEDTFVDAVGIGEGVWRRLEEQGFMVNPVKEGSKAEDENNYANTKAEAYWKLRDWIKQGGSLEEREEFYQLAEIRFKEDSGRRIKIEPKEEMRKRGQESPDVADALMLTFCSQKVKNYYSPPEELGFGGVKPYL